MKFLIVLLATISMASCGKFQGSQGPKGAQGAAGAAGQNAIISTGPIGSSLPNGLSTCHHDYEFQSNHWLILRHQKNGQSDQGVGYTGFDLWNVDIADFLLISEVGNVTYCSVHFDSSQMTLSYQVVSPQDGKQGEVGTIDLLSGNVR